MWLSKMVAGEGQNELAENGVVTLSSNGSLEAGSTLSSRSISAYSPYGYCATMPVGEELLLIPSSNGQVAVGVKTKSSNIESGEIEISSLGGAKIVLKNDGTVQINSLVIDKNGVIKQ